MQARTMLVALGLAVALGFAHAQTNRAEKAHPAAADSDKPDASEQAYSKEAYVIERYSMRFTAEADGTGTREVTAEVKVLADAGVKAFGVLSFAYTSSNEVVDIDYVRVRKPDGTVVQTPDYNIQDMPGEVTRTAPLYSDLHEKHVAVKGLRLGDVLEYLVRFRVVKPQVPGQFWFEHSFITDGIVKDERLEISVPSGKYVKVVSPEFKPEVKEEGARRVYRWTHANLKRDEKDPRDIPRRIPPSPSVQLTTFASWEEVGRWYGDLQKGPGEVTPAIQAKAVELTKGLKTDDEKFRALYNFVSLQFHYIGLDFGIGRYQPHAADDVLGNGYGDCKDKHTLLASLLKAAGYEAWPALINAQRKLDPDVPSPAQFNHVITVIPNGGKLIWLDTTPEVAPYGLLMLLLRDKEVLVIPSTDPASNKAPKLMKTPAESPFPQHQEFTAEGTLGLDGTFTGHMEQTYRGDSEVLLRLLFRQVSQAQWKEATQGFSSRLGFGGEVSNVKVTPPEEMDEPFRLSYDYVRKNYSDWENKQFTPPLPPMGIEASRDEKKPREPVLLGAVGEVAYRSKFVLPPGYSVIPPTGVNLVEPYAEYHATSNLLEGALFTSRRLIVKQSEVALDHWESIRDFGKAISDDEWKFVSLSSTNPDIDQTFRTGIDAMQRQDFTLAETSFQKVIASQPKYPLVHLNFGGTLLMKGKIDAALAEFHQEQEASPNDLRAYQIPALYLARLGRTDDAITEWRRLLKANPQNNVGALNVSQLLSQEGKYSEAALELESAVKAFPKSPELQFALGSAYLKTGQSEQAVTHIRAAVEDSGGPNPDPMMLNNAAYALGDSKVNLELARQYAEDAMTRLEQRSVNDTAAEDTGVRVTYELSLLWDTLGWIYFQGGEVTRSESFVRASWLLGQHVLVGEHMGEIYEKQGKSKEAAHAYELALAAQGDPPFKIAAPFLVSVPFSPSFDEKNYQDQRDRILSRYKKLTGRSPNLGLTERMPNGQWTKTPAEQLSDMRAIHLGKLPDFSGSAEFSIVFAPGRIESAEYLRGEESLEPLTVNLKAARYQIEFPEGSKAKIFRRAQLSCTPSAGCMAVLVPPDKARPRQNTGQY
jgi:tetratricopeptide (TPR) repeat protein